MYNKTTSANFLKYGKPTKAIVSQKNFEPKEYILTSKNINKVFYYDTEIYVVVNSGMGMLIIYDEDNFLEYAIHRHVNLKKGVRFAIVPMDDSVNVSIYVPVGHTYKQEITKRSYMIKDIRSSLHINKILAYYYVVKGPDYKFDGEIHNFYELTYVDNGCLKTTIENKEYTLNTHDLCLYSPKQFHSQAVASAGSCSYLTIIFEMNGLIDPGIFNRVFACSKEIVAQIELLAKNSDSNIPYANDYQICLLEGIIIKLLQYNYQDEYIKPTTNINQYFEDKLLEEITSYINDHIYEPLPIDQICNAFSISRSSLQNLFKDNLHISPKQYINELKLARSKVLIRQSQYTISAISNMLGYASIHYFSRKFTQRFGIAPSEYARKIYDN
ncbi:MAG: AraC family transcriptional regulator [Erysipelotrichaceae bacterium]|nr:AraC family transcriptional regulator [Erysipelotrichaceae bacterium]MDY5252508.1 AraC family transcriptional regulator [Erysipelotrichaceae bacterium]